MMRVRLLILGCVGCTVCGFFVWSTRSSPKVSVALQAGPAPAVPESVLLSERASRTDIAPVQAAKLVDRSVVGSGRSPEGPIVTQGLGANGLGNGLGGLDPRILEIHDKFLTAAERIAMERSAGATQSPRTLLSEKRLRAYAKLLKELRVFYCGPGKGMPRPVGDRDRRYMSMNSAGLGLILEIHRAEFPELFDIDDNPEKYGVKRVSIDGVK